jgi:hypothetical protein
MTSEAQKKIVSQLISKCMTDETFKNKLISDPIATLAAEGFSDQANIQDSTEFKNAIITLVHSINDEGELSDLKLDDVAAGHGSAGLAA